MQFMHLIHYPDVIMQKKEHKMIREFYIENDKGQRFSMMDIENSCFLNSPSGLGYSYNTEYAQIGDNFIQNIKKITQGQISGELIFKKYDNYKLFIDGAIYDGGILHNFDDIAAKINIIQNELYKQ